jgi:hypothetical protein
VSEPEVRVTKMEGGTLYTCPTPNPDVSYETPVFVSDNQEPEDDLDEYEEADDEPPPPDEDEEDQDAADRRQADYEGWLQRNG